MLRDILTDLGYSEKEARIYLALVELWPSPASTVGRFCWENRVTAYSILGALARKGVVSESAKGGVKQYESVEPEILVRMHRVRLDRLNEALPAFCALASERSAKPKTTFYDGIEGLRNLLRRVAIDFERHPDMPLRCFLSAEGMDAECERSMRRMLEIEKLKPEESPTRVLLFGSCDYWYADYCRGRYDCKTVERLEFSGEHEILLYENKVVIMIYRSEEVSGTMIESRALAQGLRGLFELLWKYVPETA